MYFENKYKHYQLDEEKGRDIKIRKKSIENMVWQKI